MEVTPASNIFLSKRRAEKGDLVDDHKKTGFSRFCRFDSIVQCGRPRTSTGGWTMEMAFLRAYGQGCPDLPAGQVYLNGTPSSSIR